MRPGTHDGRPKALLLDLGNVTVRLRLEPFFRAVGAACEPRLSPTEVSARLGEGRLGHHAYERGLLGARDWHALLARDLGLGLGFGEWMELWGDTFDPNAPMQELIGELGGQVRVWGLSNTNADHLAILRRGFRIMEAFEGVTASCEVGARKPEEAIYRAALGALGLSPGEVLYLDDVPEFVAAAESLGIPSFHYTFNDAQLRGRLKGLGFSLP